MLPYMTPDPSDVNPGADAAKTPFDRDLLILLVSAIVVLVILAGTGVCLGGFTGIFFLIAAAGYVGGWTNAVMSDNNFVWPRTDETKTIRPGFIKNILAGMVAAVASWGLYGPFSDLCIMGCTKPPADVSLTVTALFSAIIIGFGGARWLSSEADKKLLTKAAALSQLSEKDEAASAKIGTSSPAEVLRTVSEVYNKQKGTKI